jgi:hypothetical protein
MIVSNDLSARFSGGRVIEQVSEGQYPANGIRHPYSCLDTRWLSEISERITRLYSAE